MIKKVSGLPLPDTFLLELAESIYGPLPVVEPEADSLGILIHTVSGQTPSTLDSDGSSAEQAVVINATSTTVGVHDEYAYVEHMWGKRNVDFIIDRQMQIDQNERNYDVLYVTMKDGSKRGFWFDITSFFGKF